MLAVQLQFLYCFAKVSGFVVAKKFFVTSFKVLHAYFSIWLKVYLEDESSISFLISGPVNTPSSNFDSLSLRDFGLRNWNAELSLLELFTKFCRRNLICKGGKNCLTMTKVIKLNVVLSYYQKVT